MADVPMDQVADFETSLIDLLRVRHKADVLDVLKEGKLTDDVIEKITAAAKEVAAKYIN